jgi:RHS repeat-associated protein
VTGHVDATRYYTLGSATVATKTATWFPATETDPAGYVTVLSFLFGDVQGSAQVMMTAPTETTPGDTFGAILPATSATTTVTRTAYTPYGSTRGGDGLNIDRGWLSQVEDSNTGLTYLNARYYDPVLARFLSPDPVIDVSNPRTLDPYMYAANNPILYSDASGLCYGLDAEHMAACATGWSTAQSVIARASQKINQFINGYLQGWAYWRGNAGEAQTRQTERNNWVAATAAFDEAQQNGVPENELPDDPGLDTWVRSAWGPDTNPGFWEMAFIGLLEWPAFMLGDVGVCMNGGSCTAAIIDAALLAIGFGIGKGITALTSARAGVVEGVGGAANNGGAASVLRGQVGVDQVAADIEAAGGRVLGREITVDAGGVRVRPDLFVEAPCGVRCFVEVKTGPNARLNPNQRIGYPAIQNEGFVPRGANAANAGLVPGATHGPTPIWTVYVP